MDPELGTIRDALEAGFLLARADAGRRDGPAPPRELVPVLRFARLPDRALSTVKQGLDRDDAFRERVWESVESSPGALEAMDEGARLYLSRPEGWEQLLAGLVEEVAADAERDEQRRQEGGAARRVEHLEAALEEATASQRGLESELAETRAELARLRRARGEAEEAHRAAEERAAENEGRRAEAVRQLEESKALAESRLERQRGLEAELAAVAGDTSREEQSPKEQAPRDQAPRDQAPRDQAPRDQSRDGRLSEGRSLEHQSSDVPSPGEHSAPDPTAGDSLARAGGAAAALEAAAEAAASLAGALGELAASFRPADRPEAAPPPAASPRENGAEEGAGDRAGGAEGRAKRPPVARRRPVRPGRGLSSDSPEGLEQLLAVPDLLVLVDGYNVSMQGWPGRPVADQRRFLLDMLGTLSVRSSADVQVVFDGAGEGDRPATRTPLPVRVHFTEAEVEADDRILEFVRDTPVQAGVVVISSDHRVRDGARRLGATPVSSGCLLDLGRSR